MKYAISALTGSGIMLMLVLVGFFLYRTKILNDDGKNQLSKIMLRIVCPALVFSAYQTDYDPKLLSGIIWSFALSTLSISIAIIVARIFISDKKKSYEIERFNIIYTNCGFMGIPLVQGIFGSEGVLYVTTYLTMFNIFGWTHGVSMIKGEINFKSIIKAFNNPTIIAAVLGFIFYVTGIRLPKVFGDTIGYVASLNTPVAMFIAGATIATSNITKIVKNGRIMFNCLIKLIILPVIVMGIFKLIPGIPSSMVFTTVLIATACPSAALGTMLAIEYKKDAVYCAEIFAVSTLFSIVTLPLVVMLAQFVYAL